MKKNSSIIEHESLSEKTYKRLLHDIINKKRPPKQKLSEGKLAKEFGVSRIPVREALARLTKEGMVASIPRCGKYVKELTIDDVKNIYEIRQVLEPMALRTALSKIELKDIQRIKYFLNKSKKMHGVSRQRALLSTDKKLHYLIRHCSGNKILEDILEKFDFVTRPLRVLDAEEPDRMERLTIEREKIIDAIIQKDQVKAEELLIMHIKKGEERILTMLKEISM